MILHIEGYFPEARVFEITDLITTIGLYTETSIRVTKKTYDLTNSQDQWHKRAVYYKIFRETDSNDDKNKIDYFKILRYLTTQQYTKELVHTNISTYKFNTFIDGIVKNITSNILSWMDMAALLSFAISINNTDLITPIISNSNHRYGEIRCSSKRNLIGIIQIAACNDRCKLLNDIENAYVQVPRDTHTFNFGYGRFQDVQSLFIRLVKFHNPQIQLLFVEHCSSLFQHDTGLIYNIICKMPKIVESDSIEITLIKSLLSKYRTLGNVENCVKIYITCVTRNYFDLLDIISDHPAFVLPLDAIPNHSKENLIMRAVNIYQKCADRYITSIPQAILPAIDPYDEEVLNLIRSYNGNITAIKSYINAPIAFIQPNLIMQGIERCMFQCIIKGI